MGEGLLALEATGILTQDADPGDTTLVDARNGFNDLIRLTMSCMVRHLWTEGSRFVFNNCYRHWVQLLLRHPANAPFIILSQEGFT